MPIEINGEKKEPYVGMRGIKKRVTFKITTPPLRAKTEDGIVERPLSSLSVPASYTKRNSNGGHETVKYYENKTPIVSGSNGGEIRYRYTPEFIEIINGEIVINTKDRPDLYYFLLNHPDNESNPIYEESASNPDAKELKGARRTAFQFFETDRDKAKKNTESLMKETQVAGLIQIISDERQLNDKNALALYRVFGYPDADELEELEEYNTVRAALISQAKTNPDLFQSKMDSAALFLEATVNDAISRNMIVYDQLGDFNGWMFPVSKENPKGKKICPIESHQYEQRIELLMDFLRTDKKGITVAKQLKEDLAIEKTIGAR